MHICEDIMRHPRRLIKAFLERNTRSEASLHVLHMASTTLLPLTRITVRSSNGGQGEGVKNEHEITNGPHDEYTIIQT